MPVKNGCIPDAPDGGHITQAGTVPEGATTAVPEAAPVAVCDDEADRAAPAVDGAVPVDVVVGADVVPVAAVPEPPVAAAVGVLDVDCVAATGLPMAGETVAPGVPVPRVTIPFGVTLPEVAGV